jgi:hypothetical protein
MDFGVATIGLCKGYGQLHLLRIGIAALDVRNFLISDESITKTLRNPRRKDKPCGARLV